MSDTHVASRTHARMSSADTLHSDDRADEERKGLLSGKENPDDQSEFAHWSQRPWPHNRIIAIAVVFIFLLIGGTLARVLLVNPPSPLPPWTSTAQGGRLASNGTHDFKKTVLMVSIDGLRYVFPCSSGPNP